MDATMKLIMWVGVGLAAGMLVDAILLMLFDRDDNQLAAW